VLRKNGPTLKIENRRNQDSVHREIKSRGLRVKAISPLKVMVIVARKDAQSDQEETKLHKKAPPVGGAFYFN